MPSRKAYEEMIARLKLGATGEFPGGKISDDDEGELRMIVGLNAITNMIEMQFGKPISWIAMSPDDARALANSLNFAADAAPKKN